MVGWLRGGVLHQHVFNDGEQSISCLQKVGTGSSRMRFRAGVTGLGGFRMQAPVVLTCEACLGRASVLHKVVTKGKEPSAFGSRLLQAHEVEEAGQG